MINITKWIITNTHFFLVNTKNNAENSQGQYKKKEKTTKEIFSRLFLQIVDLLVLNM